jgi:hypothetical protein
MDRDAAVVGELERVAQQVQQNLLHLLPVARKGRQIFCSSSTKSVSITWMIGSSSDFTSATGGTS